MGHGENSLKCSRSRVMNLLAEEIRPISAREPELLSLYCVSVILEPARFHPHFIIYIRYILFYSIFYIRYTRRGCNDWSDLFGCNLKNNLRCARTMDYRMSLSFVMLALLAVMALIVMVHGCTSNYAFENPTGNTTNR